jgi:hypothetical protein
MLLLSVSPEYDRYLPEFIGEISPQHAELFARGLQLQARLPAYLVQQLSSWTLMVPFPQSFRLW